jgi:hypothetical protein
LHDLHAGTKSRLVQIQCKSAGSPGIYFGLLRQQVASNLDRYKADLDALIARGDQLENAVQKKCLPEEFNAAVQKKLGSKAKDFIAKIPNFDTAYQRWYSEAKVLIKLLLPDRLADFVRHYEKPKPRKDDDEFVLGELDNTIKKIADGELPPGTIDSVRKPENRTGFVTLQARPLPSGSDSPR